MKLKILSLSCLFAAALTTVTQAQTTETVSEVLSPMSSPNMATVKGFEGKMNYYDGTMNIQIPLYTLSEFGLNVPIELRYKTSGIKVEDTASTVGLGWNLVAGGRITRIVQRDPDESEKGFCAGIWWTPQSLFKDAYGSIPPPSVSLGRFVVDGSFLQKKKIDLEPDLFYFEIPNYSGLFVCDYTGKVHTIPYQNLNIKWVDKSYFVIKDTAGNTYTLGETDATREKAEFNNGEKSVKYVSTWLLDKIEDQFDHQISFKYYGAGFSTSITNYRKQYTFYIEPSRGGDRPDRYVPSRAGDPPIINPKKYEYKAKDKNTTLTIENPKYLSHIHSQNTTVFFNLITRTDIPRSWRCKQIEITTKDAPKTIIPFEQSYFANGALKLDAVDLQLGAQTQNIAKFHYCTTPNLPARNSMDFDHWGYYNGKNNTTLFPYFNTGSCEFSGADHSPSLYYTKANVLTRIEQPLGGYTEYKYDLNTVQENGETIDVGGLRVKQIIISDGTKASTTSFYYTTSITDSNSTGIRAGATPIYEYSGSSGSSYISYLVPSHRDDEVFNMLGNTTEYYRVIEKLPNGSYNSYEYLTSNDAQCKDVKWMDYYCVGSSFYGTDRLRGRWGREPNIKSSRFWRRGLLHTAKHYDANDNLVSSVINNYSFGNPKGSIEGHVPLTSCGQYIFRSYKWDSEPVYLTKTTTEAGPYNMQSTVDYLYDTVRMVPTRIIETDGAGNRTIKTITYPFNYKFYYIKNQTTSSLHNLAQSNIIVPVETITVKNGKILSGEYNEYKYTQSGMESDGYHKYALAIASKSFLPLNVEIQDFYDATVVSDTLVIDSKYKKLEFFDHYDSNGQLLSSHQKDGIPTSTIYGYNGTLPIARVKNAVATEIDLVSYERNNEVFHTSFENETRTCSTAKTGAKVHYGTYSINVQHFIPGRYSLTYWKSTDSGKTWSRINTHLVINDASISHVIGGNYYIDEVRMMPLDALMTTCTYIPCIGKTSETDLNGFTTYYEYDDLGRLIKVLDNDRNPIKAYEYNLKH